MRSYKQKYETLLDRFYQVFKFGRERELELEEIIIHCWVHSGYHDCGRKQMTTKQKTLFDEIVNRKIK